MAKSRCLTCKQTIVQVRKNHIYCSAKCRLIAWNLSHPRVSVNVQNSDDKTEANREVSLNETLST